MRLAVTAVLTVTALTCTAGPALATAEVSAADKAAMTKTVKAADASTDAAKSCAAYSPTLIKKMFGSKKQCLISQTPTGPSDLPKSITLSSISVSGSKAKVKVTEHGGDGATGSWQLTKSGGKWLVSLVGADFLRSGLKKALGSGYKSAGPKVDALDSKAYRMCGVNALLARNDKDFLTFAYQLASARNTVFGKVFSACSSKAPGGKSPWRKLFEAGLKQADDAQGVPADLTSCVITKLRSAVSEPTLINTLLDGAGSPSDTKFNQTIANVSNACNKGGATGQVRAPQGIIRRPPVR